MAKTRGREAMGEEEKDMYVGRRESQEWKILCNMAFISLLMQLWNEKEKIFVLDGVNLLTTRLLKAWLAKLDYNRDVEIAQCFPDSFRMMKARGKTKNIHFGTVRRWLSMRRPKVRAAFLDYCGTLKGRKKPLPSDPHERPSILADIELLFRRKRLLADSALGLTFCARSKRKRSARAKKDETLAVEHVTECAREAGLAVEVMTRLHNRAMVFLLFRLTSADSKSQ